MRLLITGGTGFIGLQLALAAKLQGFDIIVNGVVRNDDERFRESLLRHAGIELVHGLLDDPQLLDRITHDRDIIIHLAAAQHESDQPESFFNHVNVTCTGALLEAALRAGVKRFVYGSSIGVYAAAEDRTLDEMTPPSPANYYGRSKLAAELLVTSYAPRIEATIVRICETYGPGDFRLLKMFRAVENKRFPMIGSGANLHQMIFIDDLVRGLLIVAQHDAAKNELFLLAGSEVLTTQQALQCVAKTLGEPEPSLHVPLWPMLLAALAMEITFKPLGLKPPLHRRRLDYFRKSFVFSTRKARELLGFDAQTTFDVGAARTADWYRDNGKLRARPAVAAAVTLLALLAVVPHQHRALRLAVQMPALAMMTAAC
ncbi:MAG: NAD(P)-dependent oxidoreductase [Steroidobacteraceae bacterium]